MEDKRIQRTRAKLQSTLQEMILEQGYDAISIRELTDRANVGYATFFRHYKTIDELLFSFLDENINDLRMSVQFDGELQSLPNAVLIFEYVNQNSDLYTMLTTSKGFRNILHQVQERDAQILYAQFEKAGLMGDYFHLLANHTITSISDMVRWWLTNDKPYSTDEMGKLASELILQPVFSLIVNNHPKEDKSFG